MEKGKPCTRPEVYFRWLCLWHDQPKEGNGYSKGFTAKKDSLLKEKAEREEKKKPTGLGANCKKNI